MAPLKPVRELFDFCLDESLVVIHGHIKKSQEDLSQLRKILIGLLHGGIRDQLIDRAVSYARFVDSDLLNFLEVLADSAIKKLQFKKNGEFLTCFQSKELYSRIDGSNITGLHELHVKVKMEHSLTSNMEVLSSSLFHNALRRGLASNLRVLTLHNAADNQSLKIIGQHAQQLTHLDITSSWLVDDVGIGDLLLRDASEVIKAHVGGTETCEPGAIEALAGLPKSQMNKTCETLQEVRIQDTNTTSVSVLLLLMFGANLRSLGGFLYYRNIGDAVLSVQMREGAPPHLPLSELWDTYLPLEKLFKISKYLPKLSTLYTRAAWLPMLGGILPPLTNLTADFDFMNYRSVLYPFLQFSGESIRKLTLIDQVYRLDISKIGKSCPNLEDLTAKVTVKEEESAIQLKHLLYAKVRITEPSTFVWIMKHAPNIQRFESLFEWKEDQELFDNRVIMRLINDCPQSLQSIRHLSMFNDPASMVRSGTPTIEAAYALCEACNNLRILGELHTWINVSQEDVQRISDYIRKNNWDIKISFKDVVHPQLSDVI